VGSLSVTNNVTGQRSADAIPSNTSATTEATQDSQPPAQPCSTAKLTHLPGWPGGGAQQPVSL